MSVDKDRILGAIDDLCADFFYYDRKGDEDLPMDSIEDAIHRGEVTVDHMVDRFRANIERQMDYS